MDQSLLQTEVIKTDQLKVNSAKVSLITEKKYYITKPLQ